MTTTTVDPITRSGTSSKPHPSSDRKGDRHVKHGAHDSVASESARVVEDGGEELSKDIIWEKMFEELKAIKEKTGTCNLPDKKGQLAKWVYAQRKAFRRLQFSRGTATTRARLAKLESIGFEFSSSSYVSWDLMFEKYKKRDQGKISDDESRKLKLWMSNQRLEYSRQKRGLSNNITQERIAKLEAAGFQWVGRTGKPTSTTTPGDGNESVSTNEDDRRGRAIDKAELNRGTKKRRRMDKGLRWRSSSNDSFNAATKTTNVSRNHGREMLLDRDHGVLSSLSAIKHVTMGAARAGFRDVPESENEDDKDDAQKVGWAHRRKEAGSSLAAIKRATIAATPADLSELPASVDVYDKDDAQKVGWKHRKSRNEEHDDDTEVENDESDSSCSQCDQVGSFRRKEYQKLPPPPSLETRENENLRQPVIQGGEHTNAPSLGVGEFSLLGVQQSTAGLGRNLSLLAQINPGARKESDFKFSNAVMAAELDRNAASGSVDSKNDIQREIDRLTAAASSNSASLGNAYFSSLAGQGLPSPFLTTAMPARRESLPHGLTNFSTGFIQLPITTISSFADSGGLFIPSYLSSAAAALVQQQSLQQQSIAGLSLPASNDLVSNLQLLGGAGSGNHLGLPPSVYNALISRYPTLATSPLGGIAEDQNLGELYHPMMARFLPPR